MLKARISLRSHGEIKVSFNFHYVCPENYVNSNEPSKNIVSLGQLRLSHISRKETEYKKDR